MEKSSTIIDSWKLCTFGSILGCLIILLFLNQNDQNVSFSAFRSFSTLGLRPLGDSNSPNGVFVQPQTPFNYTTNVVEKPNVTLNQTELSSMLGVTPLDESESPNGVLVPPQTPSNYTTNVVEKPNVTLNQTVTPLGELKTSNSIVVEPQTPSNYTTNVVEKPNVTLNHTELSSMLGVTPLGELNTPNVTVVEPLVSSNSTTNVVEKPNITLDHTETPSHTAKLNVTLSHIETPTTNKTKKKCNIFQGRWVYRPEQARKYDTNTCPFLEEKMSCQKNGRPDSEYEKWQWEATDCNVPLFNGTDMLERLRNKRVIIVGDSLNRNMWESLACLMYTSVPSSRTEVQAESSTYKVFKAKDYNCVIEFYWSPFLVELNEEDANGKKILVLDKLPASSKRWKGADVMVFNSGHWWIHLGKFKVWDFMQYEGKLMEEMPIEVAYERGMKTWAKWVKKNVNPKKTTVFFRSISPEHKNKQWCYNVTQPIMDESYVSLFPKSLIDIVEGIIKGLKRKIKVKYLNITKLSSYRRDAHPSVYRSLQWKLHTGNTAKDMTLIENYADCSHWCLPGLPDTWNRLLYTSLFFSSSGEMSSS